MTETRPPDAAMPDRAKIGRRLAGIAAALGLLALAVWMLATFLPALAWAVVLAIATWPVFVAARARIGRDWAAMAMTVLILVVILAPLVCLSRRPPPGPGISLTFITWPPMLCTTMLGEPGLPCFAVGGSSLEPPQKPPHQIGLFGSPCSNSIHTPAPTGGTVWMPA